MAIAVQSIVSRCQAQLDSESSEYFLFAQDFLPAILSAQDFVVSEISKVLGTKKFSEEILADVTLSRIFQTSLFSRLQLDPAQLGHDVWTILSVEPECTTTPAFFVRAAAPQNSLYRSDLSVTRSPNYGIRLNADEWSRNIKNPFVDGHELETGEAANSYSYLNYTDYTGGYTVVTPEITIRPDVLRRPVNIRYVKVPTKPTLITDNIEFPMMVFDIMVSATLIYMGVKIGDRTTLESLSTQLLTMLIKE